MKPLIRGTPGISHNTQAARAFLYSSTPNVRKIFTTDTDTKAAQAQQINTLNYLNCRSLLPNNPVSVARKEIPNSI